MRPWIGGALPARQLELQLTLEDLQRQEFLVDRQVEEDDVHDVDGLNDGRRDGVTGHGRTRAPE